MFVRTENGIYETIKCLGDGSCYCNNGNKNKYISSFEILKQSDSIEELCDEFIDEELHYIIKNKEIIKDIPNKPELKNHKIYGAIWTDKGLIYVAKMNNEREFELL